jgi:hypothetical protein
MKLIEEAHAMIPISSRCDEDYAYSRTSIFEHDVKTTVAMGLEVDKRRY